MRARGRSCVCVSTVSLGLYPTPKKRLVEFYMKHNPDKVADVDSLVKTHAADYTKLIKRLESKYHDYGFFLGWDKENDFATLQKKSLEYVSANANRFYQQYMPFQVSVGFRSSPLCMCCCRGVCTGACWAVMCDFRGLLLLWLVWDVWCGGVLAGAQGAEERVPECLLLWAKGVPLRTQDAPRGGGEAWEEEGQVIILQVSALWCATHSLVMWLARAGVDESTPCSPCESAWCHRRRSSRR